MVSAYLGVLGITEGQHREVQRLRHDVCELLPYLNEQRLFVSLNHVASRINGHITAAHVVALMPWLNGLETRNGSRLASQNRTAEALALAYRKVGVGGSDSHTARGIGRTWIEAHGVTTRDEFLEALHAGRVTVGGQQGHYFTMAEDILRASTSFYADRLRMVIAAPADWRRHAVLACCGILGLPLVSAALAIALGHFILEDRFNRNLLVDLVARPRIAPEAV